ncbi:DUF1735 domain-containing protein [uncultured Bacteroides sp.]|jgi:hypothetical protein|uniref:DUF1735 domain-containing protein n=1 Tax=uncultured Bacteroides sp. TaxID=162156 RepID=UPI00258E143F|nr:DUF1735 domain-containing protein [uncultured Bacteroides sp.]
MRNLIIRIIMVVTSISFFIACEDNRMDGMVKDKVYLVQSGVQEVYVNYRDFADFTITIYKSGIGEQAVNASIEIDEEILKVYNEKENTSFEVLPDVCYSISKTNFDFSVSAVSYKSMIVFDGDIIKRFQQKGEKKYVLPLKLHVDGDVEVNEASSQTIIMPILE